MSSGTPNGRFVTQAGMSCVKHPRGVKLRTGLPGAGGSWKSPEGMKIASAPGGPDTHRSRRGSDLERPTPLVTDESEAQRG